MNRPNRVRAARLGSGNIILKLELISAFIADQRRAGDNHAAF
jgi:hypothetical protein